MSTSARNHPSSTHRGPGQGSSNANLHPNVRRKFLDLWNPRTRLFLAGLLSIVPTLGPLVLIWAFRFFTCGATRAVAFNPLRMGLVAGLPVGFASTAIFYGFTVWRKPEEYSSSTREYLVPLTLSILWISGAIASFSLVYIHWTRRRPGWDQQPQQPHDVGIELPAYSSQPQTAGQQPSRPPPARPPPAHHAPIRYQPEQSDYSDQEGLLANAARPGDSRPRRYSFERDHGVEHPNPTFHPHGQVPGEPESSDAMSSSDDEDDERDERPYHRPSSRTFHI